MQVRHIAFVVLSLLIAGGLITLLLEVRQTSEVEITEQQRQRARQRYQKSQAQRPPAPSLPPAISRPLLQPRKKTSQTVAESTEPAESKSRAVGPAGEGTSKYGALRTSRNQPREAESSETEIEGGTMERRMDVANRRYNHGDYDGAIAQARSVLAEHPDNVRMMRVMVASGCLSGNEDLAREYYPKLPEKAKRVMRVRCARYDIEL